MQGISDKQGGFYCDKEINYETQYILNSLQLVFELADTSEELNNLELAYVTMQYVIRVEIISYLINDAEIID